MYDVIVVGARCAGSPLAMLLSRKGYRILLVDKARFPSDTMSTHLIWHAGLARAKRWGLLDRIAGLGAPPIRAVSLAIDGIEISGTPPAQDGVDYALAPRRTVLDKVLVDAAEEAGAELREGYYISGIVEEDGRVTGISGSAGVEKAHLVVGADGSHSLVARSVNAPKYNERPSTACAYYAYWKGAQDVAAFESYVRPGCGGGVVPTNGGTVCIVAGWCKSFLAPGEEPEHGFRRFVESVPRLTEICRRARQVEPLMGMREFPGFFRKSWGPGWALAGDAAYHKHPMTAQGITDAFRDADLLAEAIDRGFRGECAIEKSLGGYEARRNEAVMPMYESTCMRARLEPLPPQVAALFRALQHNQPEADRFFGTDAGTVPMGEFFSPGNLERIVGSAPSSVAGRA